MRKRIGGMLIAMLAMHSAYAFNLSFLDDSPVSYFTKSDWAMAESATFKALNGARDKVKVYWRNPKTKANGYALPLQTFTKNGTTCRSLKIFNEAHEVTGQSVYVFCKINGEWKISS